MTCNAIKRDSSRKSRKKTVRATKRIRELLCQFTDGNHCKTGTSADFSRFLCSFWKLRDRFSSFLFFHFPLLHYVANFLVCFHWKKIITRKLNKLKRLFYNSYAISRLWKSKHLYFYWIFFVLFHFIFCSSNVINKIRFWPDFIGFRRSIQNRARTFIQIQMPKALLEPGLLLIAI